jgi:shikimate dehydrogenase
MFPTLLCITSMHGALITMPRKVSVAAMVDELSVTAQIAGSCNAVPRRPDGSLLGDTFDGSGFLRGAVRKGCTIAGARALVVGAGGVGSAIVASLAAARLCAIGLFDVNAYSAAVLANRLRAQYPGLEVHTGSNDPAGWDISWWTHPAGHK